MSYFLASIDSLHASFLFLPPKGLSSSNRRSPDRKQQQTTTPQTSDNKSTMNALRTTVARASTRVTQRVQKRQASGAAAPQWTGIDKVIRDKFPEDYQGEHIGLYLRWSCWRNPMPSL